MSPSLLPLLNRTPTNMIHPRLARLAILGLSSLLAEQGSPLLALDARNIALSLLSEDEPTGQEGAPDHEGNAPLPSPSARSLDEDLLCMEEDDDDDEEDDDEEEDDENDGRMVLDVSTPEPEGVVQLQGPEPERDPEPDIWEVASLLNQDVQDLQRKADLLKDALSSQPRGSLSEVRLQDLASSSRDQARPPVTPPSQRIPLSEEDRMRSQALSEERVLRIRSRTSLDAPYSSAVTAREGRVVTGSPAPVRVVTPPVHNVMFLGISSQVPQYSEDEQDSTLPSLFFDRIESELLKEQEGGPYPPLFQAFFEDPAYRTHKRALCQVVSSINLGLYPPSAIFPVLRAFEEFPASFLSQALSSDPRFEGSFSLQEDSAVAQAILSGFFKQIQDWVPSVPAASPPPDHLAPLPMKRLLSLNGEVGVGVEVEAQPASQAPEASEVPPQD